MRLALNPLILSQCPYWDNHLGVHNIHQYTDYPSCFSSQIQHLETSATSQPFGSAPLDYCPGYAVKHSWFNHV
jgi:hypothetical protein